MKYWITTDTHFGHKQIHEYCDRPEGFEQTILDNINRVTQPDDVLIHLGDIAWGDVAMWHERFMTAAGCTCILVRGNHDAKSVGWYHSHGWALVVESLRLKMHGKNILLSHKPQPDTGYDINIHGHHHNKVFRVHQDEMAGIRNDKQKLVMLEHNYELHRLRTLCGQ